MPPKKNRLLQPDRPLANEPFPPGQTESPVPGNADSIYADSIYADSIYADSIYEASGSKCT